MTYKDKVFYGSSLPCIIYSYSFIWVYISYCCVMGWLWLVGSLKIQVSFAEYGLFYRALLQKRPMFLGSLRIAATSYLIYYLCIIYYYLIFNRFWDSANQHTATHCNTLQHTATHCDTLQHTATHCNTLQNTATHCNALQHTATHATHATRCNALQ